MDFKKGKLVPISRDGIPLGSVVSYGDMANSRKKSVVVEASGDAYGQKCVQIDSLSISHVSKQAIDGPGGWHLESDAPWTAEACAVLLAKGEKMQAALYENQRLKSEIAAKANAEAQTKGAPKIPAWATHVIVANRVQDQSDSQTDYFASTTKETVLLAFSKHGRDNFAEMRKAAATFEPTKHLGPGKDDYTVRVVLSQDIPFDKAHNGGYFKGTRSHWHHELDGDDHGVSGKHFQTKAEAEAFVASAPKPEPISFDGFLAEFEWSISCEEVEHREKWSMGHGYYLKSGGRHWSGWEVKKTSVGADTAALIGMGKYRKGLV